VRLKIHPFQFLIHLAFIHVFEVYLFPRHRFYKSKLLSYQVKLLLQLTHHVLLTLNVQLSTNLKELINNFIWTAVALYFMVLSKQHHIIEIKLGLKFKVFEDLISASLFRPTFVNAVNFQLEVDLVVFVVLLDAFNFVVLSHLLQHRFVVASPLV
jgi:hypothetical protein